MPRIFKLSYRDLEAAERMKRTGRETRLRRCRSRCANAGGLVAVMRGLLEKRPLKTTAPAE